MTEWRQSIVEYFSKRLSLISDWKELPGFISLNGDETGFEKAGLCCLRHGIGILVRQAVLYASGTQRSSKMP